MKKVLLGMSGGVDSSVSAILLLNQGYDVTGITLKLIPPNNPQVYLPKMDIIAQAKSCAKNLGIEHISKDFSDVFSKKVINNFVSEYLGGRTPNPCVRCNKYIKFGSMLEIAKELNFDYIATGHYANISYDSIKDKFLLKRSKSKKDQSYFLYNLTQDQLAHTLFPIGDLDKSEVREIANKYNLPTALNPDSQEICFISNEKYSDFIHRNANCAADTPGNFIDINGNILGIHKGIMYYTIGQRKNLGISFGEPMYVVKINALDNTITLADQSQLYIKHLLIRNLNFIYLENLEYELTAFVKMRYQAVPSLALITPIDSQTLKITFDTPQKMSAPGQSAVFYDRDAVIGGGIINEIIL